MALVLAGGAAYSLTELGALEWLEEHRIPVDCMVGTSGGALVGGWYSTGIELLTDQELSEPLHHGSPSDMRLHGIAKLLDQTDIDGIFRPNPAYDQVDMDEKDWQRNFPAGPTAGIQAGQLRFTDGLIAGSDLEQFLGKVSRNISDSAFDHLPIPFRSVAVRPFGDDVREWRQVTLGGTPPVSDRPNDQISLADAIRASIAIPFVFTPRHLVQVDPNSFRPSDGLIDGGVRDNFPTDVACDEFNPDAVIGLHIPADLTPLEWSEKFLGHRKQNLREVEKLSNCYKVGKSGNAPREHFEIPMGYGPSRLDQFDQWRRLSYLGYQSMESYAKGDTGQALLALSLPLPDYLRYRQMRRLKRSGLDPSEADKTNGSLDEETATKGLGSIQVEAKGPKSVQMPEPRSIGPLQFSVGADGQTSGGDRTSGDVRLGVRDFGLGSPYSHLDAQLQAGTSSSASLGYTIQNKPGFVFFRPFALAESIPFSKFSGSHRDFTEQLGDQRAGLQVGDNLSNFATASLSSEAGQFDFLTSQHFLEQIAKFQFDSFNSELFPTHGLRVNAWVKDTSIGPDLHSLYQSQVRAETRFALSACSTLILGGGFGTSFGASPPVELQFRLGGLGILPGVPTDWQISPSYSIAQVSFAQKVLTLPYYMGTVQWISGVDASKLGQQGIQDVYTGILAATRVTNIYAGTASGSGTHPRLILAFGNQPFALPSTP